MLATPSPCLGRTTISSCLENTATASSRRWLSPFDVVMTPKEEPFSNKFLSVQIPFGQGPPRTAPPLGEHLKAAVRDRKTDYSESHSGAFTTAFAIPNTIISTIILAIYYCLANNMCFSRSSKGCSCTTLFFAARSCGPESPRRAHCKSRQSGGSAVSFPLATYLPCLGHTQARWQRECLAAESIWGWGAGPEAILPHSSGSWSEGCACQ